MTGSDYYIPAVVLAVALVVKSPSFLRTWHSPMSKSIFVILAASAAGFVFGAPPTIERVNRLTGVPNISALIVYCILSCLSCGSLVLLIHWRGGTEGTVRRHTRVWIAATAAVITTFCVLFSLSDVPIEQQREFDTFYATTPYVREMIVLYLSAHTATSVVVATKCWRWARELRQVQAAWTHWGLLILVAAFSLTLSFALFKFLAVGARWAGTDTWDWLSTDVAPPLAGLGAAMTTIGFLVPVVGPRLGSMWVSWRAYRAMKPLWHALEPFAGPGKPMRIRPTSSLEIRAMARSTEIADRLLNLAPHLDGGHREAAERYASSQGCKPEAALIFAEAATIHAALAAARVPGEPESGQPESGEPESGEPEPGEPESGRKPFALEPGGALPTRVSGTNGLARLSIQFSKIHHSGLPVGGAHSESD
ncbi:MAB_1171c family putative transporter [Streptomyces sp. NPDC058622]|uniref:MAB_1171c family putative transporter n=1 Tax=Streptomyces sp. NPDC058622 TaxID=3346562 RepID=UPI003648C1A4